MPKFIHDEAREQYKKQLAEFSQQINPKQPAELLEILKQKYIQARK